MRVLVKEMNVMQRHVYCGMINAIISVGTT